MFKKYVTENDSKKLLSKALDLKKDPPVRLKHFKTFIEGSSHADLVIFFAKYYSVVYHTFVEAFSLYDHSKHRKDDLDCLLFILEKVLTYNTDLIRGKWQFRSITTVMQRLLHRHTTYRVRDDGVRLFLIWYQILANDEEQELKDLFVSIVPDLVINQSTNNFNNNNIFHPLSRNEQYTFQTQLPNHNQRQQTSSNIQPNIPNPPTIKPLPIEPLIPANIDEELPNKVNEISFYLDKLLEYMITQSVKPVWSQQKETNENQEYGFAFLFEMFKKVYLSHLFPNIQLNHGVTSHRTFINFKSTHIKYIDERSQESKYNDNIHQDQKLAVYQAVIIKWLTRLLRQDTIPGQEELANRNGQFEGTKNSESIGRDFSFNYSKSAISNISPDLEIARKVVGTYADNITTIHEIFRQAFLNYYQPSSMKRVVNVYKELIFNHVPTPQPAGQPKPIKIGYSSYNDLLQTFLFNSSNAFLVKVSVSNMLDEQFEMCKRIMNIYRFMVMKIFMNSATWEQLLNIMLSITKHLFEPEPPEKREQTISGKIAPAFFQTLLVSWIRANLYVHISNNMWVEFQHLISKLVQWKELVDEWNSTMTALTRVLVKHAYGLDLDRLPLDESLMNRRDRPRAVKSLSTAQGEKPQNSNASQESQKKINEHGRSSICGVRIFDQHSFNQLRRCNSEGLILVKGSTSSFATNNFSADSQTYSGRRIKSDYLDIASSFEYYHRERLMSQSTQGDSISTTVKESQLVIEENEQYTCFNNLGSKSKKADVKTTDSCVLLNGQVRGWTSENSVIMWRRMLGILGNINHIQIPSNHITTMQCLSNLVNDLSKTRDNQGISLDNHSTPEPPKLIPPYMYFSPWLLEATHLNGDFAESRILAYRLLCSISIRRRDIEASNVFYGAFYETLFRGIVSNDLDLQSTIVECSTKLFLLELPGSTVLSSAIIDCCKHVLANRDNMMQNNRSNQHKEAIILLNSLLSLSKSFRSIMCLKHDYNLANIDIKAKAYQVLFDYINSNNIRNDIARSRSISSVTMFIYQELSEKVDCPDFDKLLNILMQELLNNSETSKSYFRHYLELINILSDYAQILAKNHHTSIGSMLIQICQLITSLFSNCDTNKEQILNLLICLENWCIAVGKSFISKHVHSSNVSGDESSNYSESLINYIVRSLESVYQNYNINDAYHYSRGSDTPSSLVSESISNFNPSRFVGITGLARCLENSDKHVKLIKLACFATRAKLLNFIGHFPWKQIGAASLSCCVNELDFVNQSTRDNSFDLASQTDNLKNVCMLIVEESTIISLVRPNSTKGPIYMLIRNLCGKYAWDVDHMLSIDQLSLEQSDGMDTIQFKFNQFHDDDKSNSDNKIDDLDFYDDSAQTIYSLESHHMEDQHDSPSLLGQLLSTSSNRSKSFSGTSRKRPSIQSVNNNRQKISQAEETMIALLANQRFQEINHSETRADPIPITINLKDEGSIMDGKKSHDSSRDSSLSEVDGDFDHCRHLIQHMGFLFWEKRSKVETLNKSVGFLRELRNLDAQPNRETHKIAVLYVNQGQEDKNSILSNTSGSRTFEEFVAGLGWEVNLASHLGFKGGLQSNKSTGDTSIYYCNSTVEVMFHVSTRIHVNNQNDHESLNKKLRHLGNDEIHIVWSEHNRDYRRGIIPTEFGDVIIAIYPMITMFQGYYRIQIDCKPGVPSFGPLFDNCVVHQSSLAALIRATAINASRAQKFKLPHFQTHFEERYRLIQAIYNNHKDEQTFEDFASSFHAMK